MPKLPQQIADCKIAIIYDRVTTRYGGAEKVLAAIHQIFPNAVLYTSVYDSKNTEWADEIKVIPTWLQNIPFAKHHHRWLLPLLPSAFESIDLSTYNIVISVTSAEAKGVITLPEQLHICYLLTPTRYLYSHQQIYLQAAHHTIWKLDGIVKKIFKYIEWWDIAASARPDVYLPISKLIAHRLATHYQRKATQVIYPPVEDLPRSKKPTKTAFFDTYYLVISRLVPYKKIDLVIHATQLLGKNLIIVGDGPEKKHLQKVIESTHKPEKIKLLDPLPKADVLSLMRNATALVMPGIEDFGITPLEALTQETPSIVHFESGVAELLRHKKTGIHLQELTVNGLIEALEQIESTSFSTAEMKKVVTKNSTKQFKKTIQQVVTTLWKEHYVKYT